MILRLNGGETHPIEAILDAKGPGKSLSHVALGMQGICIVPRKAVCAVAVAGLDRDHVMLTPTIRGYGIYVGRY
jgi:hypothetical protein